MACMIAFDQLYPSHEFAALMVNLTNMLIPAQSAHNATRIALFFLCVFLTVLEYQSSPDGNFTALTFVCVEHQSWQNLGR